MKKFLAIGTIILLLISLRACTPSRSDEEADDDTYSTALTSSDKESSDNSSESDETDDSSEEKSSEEESSEEDDSSDSHHTSDDTSSSSTSSSSDGLSYKPVELSEFAERPNDYMGKNIKTSGNVIYIQQKPSDKNMYYVVISPQNNHTTSGYADGHGTVVEVSIDILNETPIQEGDNITIEGGGLTKTVEYNGKVVNSAIIADNVSK